MKIHYDKKSNLVIVNMEGNEVFSTNDVLFNLDLDENGYLKNSNVKISIIKGKFVSKVSGNMISFNVHTQ